MHVHMEQLPAAAGSGRSNCEQLRLLHQFVMAIKLRHAASSTSDYGDMIYTIQPYV